MKIPKNKRYIENQLKSHQYWMLYAAKRKKLDSDNPRYNKDEIKIYIKELEKEFKSLMGDI